MSDAPDIYRIQQRLTWAFAATSMVTGVVVSRILMLSLDPAGRFSAIVCEGLVLLALGLAFRSLWVSRRELARLIVFHEYLSASAQPTPTHSSSADPAIEIATTARRRNAASLN